MTREYKRYNGSPHSTEDFVWTKRDGTVVTGKKAYDLWRYHNHVDRERHREANRRWRSKVLGRPVLARPGRPKLNKKPMIKHAGVPQSWLYYLRILTAIPATTHLA